MGVLLTFWSSPSALAQADQPTVHAVIFFSPTCPHCHEVIENDLPPLMETYPEQLQIIGVNVGDTEGQKLYQAAIDHFNIPEERHGVPTLIVDDVVLVGGREIPERFPELVETYLAQGGVDWPDIPGLPDMLADMDATATAAEQQSTATVAMTHTTSTTESQTTATMTATLSADTPAAPTENAESPAPSVIMPDSEPETWQDKFAHDPAGNTLAVIVLAGMVAMVGYTAITFYDAETAPRPAWQQWAIPLLSLIGIGVASYLAYVEAADVQAVCGPVGDCNTVQQSPYARLFGIISIGMVGVIGYSAIIVGWLISRSAQGQLARMASLTLFTMTLLGTLFSIYLTFLEPFVIGATCAWCVTSAVIMTALLWLTIPIAKDAFNSQ